MPLPAARKVFVFSAVLLLLAAGAQGGDNPAPEARVSIEPRATPAAAGRDTPRASIRVDSTLVLIPVTVTDPLNRFVTGLDRDHFRIYEDKKEQSLVQFSSEDAPLSIGVVFDASGSMGSKLLKARQAVAQFFRTANPEDEAFLVTFNDRAELAVPLTNNLGEIQSKLTFMQSRGKTALLDAIYLALHQMKRANNPRKALLVISDGGDNNSRYTEGEIRNLVREADVQIYAVGIYETMGTRMRTAEELAGPGMLTSIAEQTGGRQYAVENLNDLPDITAKIGIELRNQYILGYTPENQERDGKYRKVQVRLVQPRGLPSLRAYWRMGYYAPID
jgi:Ca-activated chloride channel homolog